MSRAVRIAIKLSPALVFVGCSLDWSIPPGATSDGGSSGGATSDAPSGTDAPSGSDGSAPSDAGTGPETKPPPPPSGCSTNADCQPTDLCTFAGFGCGLPTGTKGTCAPRTPPSCAGIGNLPLGSYCACGGVSGAAPCKLLAGGTDLAICKASGTGTTDGFATCPQGAALIHDPSLPRERQYRCESTTCASTDCNCLTKTFCKAQGAGKCDGFKVSCA